MPTTNRLHEVTVDGQLYIIKRSPCITGVRNYYSGKTEKKCHACKRWRPAYKQGYHDIRQTHIILVCFCRNCGHTEFVLDDWLNSESFLTSHRDYLRRQADFKASTYSRSFQGNWAEPLHETVQMAVEDLDSGDTESAKIKLTTILDKIANHKQAHLAVEGWNKSKEGN